MFAFISFPADLVACTVAWVGESAMHGALLHMVCPGAMVSKSPAVCVAYVTAGMSNSLLLQSPPG